MTTPLRPKLAFWRFYELNFRFYILKIHLKNTKFDDLKSTLIDNYLARKQKELPDYPIFMAIAEDIGYDATGKKTAVNELDIIGEELKKFIISLDRI